MFKQILVPTDFSNLNKRALEIGVNMALQGNGRLNLLHVIEVIADTSFEEFKGFYLKLENRAKEAMDKLIEPYSETDVNIDQKIVYGNRTTEILRFTEDQMIDLIIMNSHKINPEGPTQGWGTISYKVGILAHCPVMLVK